MIKFQSSNLIFIVKNYNEEPRPEYDPQKNNPTTVRAKVPPTVAISHKGILPVLAILYLLPIY